MERDFRGKILHPLQQVHRYLYLSTHCNFDKWFLQSVKTLYEIDGLDTARSIGHYRGLLYISLQTGYFITTGGVDQVIDVTLIQIYHHILETTP
jgi:hypothetical protein